MSTAPRRIDHAMKRDALLASQFFRAMRAEDLDEVIGFATERRFPRGTVIFNKGDPGTSMMAVLVGRVRQPGALVQCALHRADVPGGPPHPLRTPGLAAGTPGLVRVRD